MSIADKIQKLSDLIDELKQFISDKYGDTTNCNTLTDLVETGLPSIPVTLGTVSNGYYVYPECNSSIIFNGLTYIPIQHEFAFKFYKMTGNSDFTVSFPDLTSISNSYAFYFTFGYSDVRNVSFPKLSLLYNYAFYNAFYHAQHVNVSFDSLTSITSSGNYAFSYAFYYCGQYSIRSTISFPNLTSVVNGDYVFNNVFGYSYLGDATLPALHPFPKLNSIDGNYVFSYAFTYLKTQSKIVFDSLESVSTTGRKTGIFQYAWNYWAGRMTVNGGQHIYFPVLSVIGNTSSGSNYTFRYAFKHTSSYETSAYFFELSSIYTYNTTSSNGQFYCCNATRIYLPKLSIATNSTYLFYNSNTTEIHFGIANQSAIEALTGYSNKFGAVSTCTFYFDMANTIVVNDVTYTRDGYNTDCDNDYYAWLYLDDDDDEFIIYTTNILGEVGDQTYTKSDSSYVLTDYTVTEVG